ncbi:MAG: DNA methyltransferase [bacterium]|nr:DNA methyltransferase [bacterium]
MPKNTTLMRAPQVSLKLGIAPAGARADSNKVMPEDRAAHDWYRFVLSFPPHLVRTYIERFGLTEHHTVLDPFCGTGTTLVECKKLGINSIGIEALPMAQFASRVKVDWAVESQALLDHASRIAAEVDEMLERQGLIEAASVTPANTPGHLKTLPPHKVDLLLKDSISPLPLHKVLELLASIEMHKDDRFYEHERLALAKALVTSISNLRFGPEVGIGAIKSDADVVRAWLEEVGAVAADLPELQCRAHVRSTVHLGDSRELDQVIEPNSIDAVFTSPPYPNEKDYTRTTRLESVILGLVEDKESLRRIKQTLLRSNTRNVYKHDDDDKWVSEDGELRDIADAIEARRTELGKTSGFERLYARVTLLYFGGMYRHLAQLRTVLKPGARVALVVGDQASYLQIMIRTGQLLAKLAQSLGYELESIDLFRRRWATATKQELREEVVVLRWPRK